MKPPAISILLLLVLLACNRHTPEFEYTITGTVTGMESGELIFMKSNRVGDELIIPFENHSFEFRGTAPNLFHSAIMISGSDSYFHLVVEPGIITLELQPDDLFEGSRALTGKHNTEMQRAHKTLYDIYDEYDFGSEGFVESITEWLHTNNNSFAAVSWLNRTVRNRPVLNHEQIGSFLNNITNKQLKESRDYLQLYSFWQAHENNANTIGTTAINFEMTDADGNTVRFPDISARRITYIEKSGSWCVNSTRASRNLLPVYEKYHNKGLEIITLVYESDKTRWKNWLNNEGFPWINLAELEDHIIEQGVVYEELLFQHGNYLVDEYGMIIANNLTAESLNEVLMQLFEPEIFDQHLADLWDMPESTVILDKDMPINSFDEITGIMQNRAFLIDCWATWCAPCLYQFQYNDQLKAFLDANGLNIVYISFDRPADKHKWLNYIKKYNLNGYHLRAGESLRNDLYALGFGGTLPTYMIVNEHGNIVVLNAHRPSDTRLLYEQLTRVLNLD